MCTVSFIQANNQVYITSNRDEKTARTAALIPKTYNIKGRKVTFPKDPKGGGTWFALNDLHTTIVLLNGAKEKHQSKPSYKKSRGLVVLDLISSEDALDAWESIDLMGIEPFTIVLYTQNKLHQLQWNESNKVATLLDHSQKYIWSSSTLYAAEIREQRQSWFQEFTHENIELNSDSILNFHTYTESSDTTNGLVMNRNNEVMTVTISQIILDQNKATFIHQDLVNKANYQLTSFIM